MEPSDTPKVAVPNYRTPKTLGILNIVFGVLLIFMGLCIAMQMLMLPTFMGAMEGMQKEVAAKVEQQKKADLERLAEREKQAATEAEKEALQRERLAIENRPQASIAPMMDMSKMGLTDPRYTRYVWFDLVTMLILNVLMIVSGIGLTRFQPKARVLAIRVAWLKIVRLALIAAYLVLVVVPFQSRGAAEMAVGMFTQQQAAMGRGGGPTLQQMTTMYGIFYTVMYLSLFVLGVIYPAICLWLLSRPGVKAALAHPDLDPSLPKPQADPSPE